MFRQVILNFEYNLLLSSDHAKSYGMAKLPKLMFTKCDSGTLTETMN